MAVLLIVPRRIPGPRSHRRRLESQHSRKNPILPLAPRGVRLVDGMAVLPITAPPTSHPRSPERSSARAERRIRACRHAGDRHSCHSPWLPNAPHGEVVHALDVDGTALASSPSWRMARLRAVTRSRWGLGDRGRGIRRGSYWQYWVLQEMPGNAARMRRKKYSSSR